MRIDVSIQMKYNPNQSSAFSNSSNHAAHQSAHRNSSITQQHDHWYVHRIC